jgi:hypothetical protein
MQPELEALWTAATRPNPAERLSTARALADAIERYLAGFRDTERRKELAQSHARTAVETARRSSTDGPSALALRALALQEAGHALALDPENVDASRVVWRLMTELPPTQPVEVIDERRKRRDDRRRADYQELTRQTLVFFAFVPFILFMGVENVGYLVAWLTMVTLLLASLVFRYRMAPAQGWNILGPFVVSQGAVLIQVTMAGPVSALPTVVSLISLGVCINHLGKDRPKVLTAVAISLATIFLTIFGDSLGLLPSFVDYPRPTEVVVHAGLLRFERAKVLAVLPGLYVSIVATSAWISLARNRQLLELQRRLRLQRWQWSQLVPSTMEQVGRSSVSMEAVSNLGNPPSSVP